MVTRVTIPNFSLILVVTVPQCVAPALQRSPHFIREEAP